MRVEVVEGWTGPLDFILKADGAPLPLAGFAVELVLHRLDDVGAVVNTTGDVSLLDAPNGVVRFEPDADDLKASDGLLSVRFKVTDGAGHVVYHPNGEPDVLAIYKP